MILPLLAIPAAALISVSTAPPGPCLHTFRDVSRTVETSYAGYPLEVAPSRARRSEYYRLRADVSARAATADRAQCHALLQEYIGFFDDPHLFLLEAPEFFKEDLAHFQSMAEHEPAGRVLAAYRQADVSTDPIIGRWSTGKNEVVIIPDGKGKGFAAFKLPLDGGASSSSEVVARFTRSGADYEALYFRSDKVPVRRPARIDRGVALNIFGTVWGRVFPDAVQQPSFRPDDPLAPTLEFVDERTALLTLPSFDFSHKAALDSLIEANKAAITSRDLLIVDLRGNIGGSSLFISPLVPLFRQDADPPIRAGSLAGSYVLASPGIIRIHAALLDRLTSAGTYRDIVESLVSRMRASQNELVPYAVTAEHKAYLDEAAQNFFGAPAASGQAHVEHVAFLTDEHTISAPEAALLALRDHPRVTLFGRNTAGATDYQNVSMLSAGQGPYRYHLGLPTIVASAELPATGYRTTGVPVDVVIDTDDPGAFEAILSHYRLR